MASKLGDLVPQFDGTIPPTTDYLGSFMREPKTTDAHRVMGLEPGEDTRRFPLPSSELSICIT